jgi:hypothetical protein
VADFGPKGGKRPSFSNEILLNCRARRKEQAWRVLQTIAIALVSPGFPAGTTTTWRGLEVISSYIQNYLTLVLVQLHLTTPTEDHWLRTPIEPHGCLSAII